MTFRLALRGLLRSPWYAATTVGTIALTISLAATVFAVVDGVLFKPLPYREPDRLFTLTGWDGRPDTGGASVALLDIRYLSEADPRVRVTGTGFGRSFVNPDRPDVSFGAAGIDAAYFDVLGHYPLVGGFTARDYEDASTPKAPTPLIVSHAFWRQWLGGDARVIGRVVQFGSGRFVVRGILPRDFVHPGGRTDALTPLVLPKEWGTDRWMRGLSGLVRLEDGITREEARLRMNAALGARASEYAPGRKTLPGPYIGVRMRPLAAQLQQNDLFSAAFAVAGLLVLLGAVNVAGLFDARARDRQRELAVRAALGGTQVRLVLTLLSESLLISLAGCGAGVLLAHPLLTAALVMIPSNFQLLKDPSIDVRVVAFAVAAAIVPVALCTLLPAFAVLRKAPARSLAGTHTTTARARGWTRGIALAVESGLGIVLVMLGALMLTSFVLIRSERAGFDSDHLAVVELLTPGVTSLEQREAREALAVNRMRALPGVQGVASFNGVLLRSMYAGSAFLQPQGSDNFFASDIPVSETFFEVAGVVLLQGRLPTRNEIASRARVAVVSEDTAAAYWPGRSAVGQTLESPDAGAVIVVGIVQAARLAAQDDEHGGEIYVPQGILNTRSPKVYLLKTSGDPAEVVQDLALIIRNDLPGVFVRRAVSFDLALADSVRDDRTRMIMFGVAGVSGLLLLVVGVVGLVASGVARRVREIGIRTALGAQQPQIVRMIIANYLRPVGIGVACGLLASWWAARLVGAFVYQIDVHEPAVFAASAVALLIAATIAAWIPARRASAVDPISTLRVE